MNLELEKAQRRLADALRQHATELPARAGDWDVFDAVGITDRLLDLPGEHALLSQLEWCVVLEELGAAVRGHATVRSVRAFLDSGGAGARGLIGQWAGEVRSGERTAAPLMPVRGAEPAVPLFPGVPADLVLDQRALDRDLLLLAAYGVGLGRRCLEVGQGRAAKRIVAGRRLLEHQGTSHRLARCALDLTLARAGLWLAAAGEDAGAPATHAAPAAAAACVEAALNCAHALVQTFGAAGTSDPLAVGLFEAAYELPAVTGSVSELWRCAGARRLGAAEGLPRLPAAWLRRREAARPAPERDEDACGGRAEFR